MLLKVRVRAGSKSESFAKTEDDRFEIAVREKPQENRANLRVIELIAMHMQVPLKSIRIIKGHRTPSKIVSVAI